MPHNRFFLTTSFTENTNVTLLGEEAHHLQRVMRKKKGELVELVNGKNALAKATIASIEKKKVQLHIQEVINSLPNFPTIICQAIPKLNRLDTIVEKGTELGMTELWLFPGDLSEKKELTPNQLKRLEMITIAAMKQCGRLDLPKIVIKPKLLKWAEKDLLYPAYFGDLSCQSPKFLECFEKKKGVLFFIGPEAGFTTNEEAHLRYLNAQGVNLHPLILRTDTAPLVALSLISQL